jgi:EAL domain-containing protein (putative c-di-GMP-specific phosphodiesterase class I)
VKCDSWQGYLYSEPLPMQEFEQLLYKQNKTSAASEVS